MIGGDLVKKACLMSKSVGQIMYAYAHRPYTVHVARLLFWCYYFLPQTRTGLQFIIFVCVKAPCDDWG